MKTSLLAALLAASLASPAALATELPPALNPNECRAICDLVWSARALHKNGVEPGAARGTLLDMYLGVFEPAERAEAYIDAAMRFAASVPLRGSVPPGVLGSSVYHQCHANRGALAPIFGTSL